MLTILAFMSGFLILWLLVEETIIINGQSTISEFVEEFKTPRSKKKTVEITALSSEDLRLHRLRHTVATMISNESDAPKLAPKD